MLAIARALMGAPRLVLLDEPSMGLAPRTVQQVFELLRSLNTQDGTALLLAWPKPLPHAPARPWAFLPATSIPSTVQCPS